MRTLSSHINGGFHYEPDVRLRSTSDTNSCERREYAFIVLRKYTIISPFLTKIYIYIFFCLNEIN